MHSFDIDWKINLFFRQAARGWEGAKRPAFLKFITHILQ